jgi:DNA polymerase bacteriophage-type
VAHPPVVEHALNLHQAVHTALIPICHLDIETFSECNLKEAGLYRYAEHPSTELLVVCYKFQGSGIIYVWVPRDTLPVGALSLLAAKYPKAQLVLRSTCPENLRYHVEDGGEVRAHNAQFERVNLNGTAGQKVNFPKLAIDQMVCTLAKMANHGLPRALGDAANALGTHRKDDTGRATMLALSQPRRGKERRYTPENSLERFIQLYAYCCDDVLAEEGIDRVVPDISPEETRVYRLDQQINDRGISVDLESVENVVFLIDQYKLDIERQFHAATGLKPTQRAQIAAWIRANGFPQLLDMQAETVKEIVAGTVCPDNVKHVLRMYSTYGMKAVTKYQTLLDMVCADGKLHGMFQYFGAGTGRWSSTGVQLQNLFRPVIDDPETAVEAFRERDLQWIKDLYPKTDPMKVFASCIRSMLVASPGMDLIFPDFAGVESRVNAWCWSEEWKLQAFRDFDTYVLDASGNRISDGKGDWLRAGPDTYKLAYARAFHVLIELVTKKMRQIGKVMELALGYEGGVGAFVTMADTYGIDLEELTRQVLPVLPDECIRSAEWMIKNFGTKGLPRDTFIACDGLKQLWRGNHPRHKTGWAQLKEASIMAVLNPGKVYRAGKALFSVRSYEGNTWLYMKLPSGRKIAYFKPTVEWGKRNMGVDDLIEDAESINSSPLEERDLKNATLRYWGVDTKTRRYMKTSSYGGKKCENKVQAISRDLLVNAMLALDDAGYLAVGSVHDEAILEVPKNFGSLDEAGRIMCTKTKWGADIPLAVEGHRAYRYRK